MQIPIISWVSSKLSALSKALELNDTLIELNLECNRMNKDALEKLLKGLKNNTTLQVLKVGISSGLDKCIDIILSKLNHFNTKKALKIPQICSPCRNHHPVVSPFMTYHWVCNKSSTTGTTGTAGTVLESAYRRTVNVMAKRKWATKQTTIYKTLHRKLKIEQHEPH
jgi:hypothetical protein